MHKIVRSLLGGSLAAMMLVSPVFAAGNTTPETAETQTAQAEANPDWPAGFTPAPLTEEEKAYTRVSPYDALDAGETTALLDGEGEGQISTYAVDGYNTANADIAYNFLRDQVGMNSAQAVGVLASMYTESRFEPTALNVVDSNGQSSYGLCQWNGGRYDALREWCGQNGYDYTTMDGQLNYLKYEITNTWEKRIWNYIGVADTADGAYEAGYNWARYYERGWSGYWESRANLARDDFWPVYGNKPTTPPVDRGAVTDFIVRLYRTCLDREPDQAGLDNWVNELVNHIHNGTQAGYGFLFSPEFQSKNYCNEDYVKHLYQALMGREYDAGGMQNWMDVLNAGATREFVFNEFMQSAEFREICTNAGIEVGARVDEPAYGTLPKGKCAACGKQDNVTLFVIRLYDTCLDRKPDADGLKAWTEALWAHDQTGRVVAGRFLTSPEFVGNNYSDEEFLTHLYRAFLDREPDTRGMQSWLRTLKSGVSRQGAIDGFAGSDEFTKICLKYGITRG